ncbi:hypothetical protein [Gimesia sp.]|uniref:hypothetical protein n=1 Tax=Gimesia sp. TaxID=2024833 RepID=UPI000C4D607F|nr:hypothetical protein [Gimesia sp.]MAX35699.1 hypothetical protein [Gimesia sp.]HBL47650.1 hypothetical protein [Planctomycetaceae bacterium]|tara:strand:+ start:310 stop:822 length:513 start_codon:yes stop_codon:yes gene_type:complete
MFNKEFLEGHDIIPAFMPIDLSADVNTGDRVNLQNYDRCLFVLLASIGTAGDDPVISAQQHTAANSGSSKPLNFRRIRHKVGATDIESTGQFMLVEQSEAASFDTDSIDGAENEALIAIEVMAKDLDSDNGFTFVSFNVDDVGSNAQLGAGFYILQGASYVNEIQQSSIV